MGNLNFTWQQRVAIYTFLLIPIAPYLLLLLIGLGILFGWGC